MKMLQNLIILSLTVIVVGNKLYEGRYTSKTSGYEVVVPEKVDPNGDFISYKIPHYYQYSEYNERIKKSLNEDDVVNYIVNFNGNNHHLELWPNTKFMSPGMVIETIDNYNASTDSRINIRRLRDTQCYYNGFVRGQENSEAAISTCYGLAGYISTNSGYYFIEPVKNHDPALGHQHPHIIYKDLVKRDNSNACGTKGSVKEILENRQKREYNRGPVTEFNFKEEIKFYHLETLVVLDKSLIEYHKDFDVENYALTVFNMAHNLYNDASLGVPVDLVLVRMIKLEAEDDEMNLAVSKNAEKTLEAFCAWQHRMNPNDDKHPNHHDLAVFLTRTDICADENTCGLLGLSKIGGTCDPDNQCNICEDSGLKLGYVITHEIGHSLGMDHDDAEVSGCNGTISENATTVMSSEVSMKVLEWSKCSQDYLRTFLDMGFGKCMEDEPTDHELKVVDLLPGVMYGGDYQCHHIVHPEAKECKSGLTCESLNCELSGHGCIHTNVFPAPGTKCGDQKWCFQRKCLAVGERPGAVDGGWGNWLSWSECSRTCGMGVSHEERICNNPSPMHGGKFCIGERKRYKICNKTPCEVKIPTFRDLQCFKYNDWIYPEDGKKHQWKAFHMHDNNPCALHCVNENRTVLEMSSRVKDGTSCSRGIMDICIAGVCKEIPCDMHLNSKAVEDICGVCHGGGTSCDIQEGTVNITQNPKKSTVIVRVPKNTRNIKVQKTEPSKTRILVKNSFGNVTYSKGRELGAFSVPGSLAWLGMIRAKQEVLNIPGPVTEDLIILAQAMENATITYSMGIKPERERKGEYQWDHVEWSSCSSECGKGIQSSTPYCIEKIGGRVDDKYCRDFKKPEAQTKECEQAACVPRWIAGEWSKCKCEGKDGTHTRLVTCVKPEGEGVIVEDFKCKKPKPVNTGGCKCYSGSRRLVSSKRGARWVKRNNIERGKIQKDEEDIEQLKFDIVCEKTGKNHTLKGKEALLYLEKLQHERKVKHKKKCHLV